MNTKTYVPATIRTTDLKAQLTTNIVVTMESISCGKLITYRVFETFAGTITKEYRFNQGEEAKALSYYYTLVAERVNSILGNQ